VIRLLFLWFTAGAIRWGYHFYRSCDPTFWDNFRAEEREYFQANMWFFDSLGSLWSLVTGPMYLLVDFYRAAKRVK